MSALDSGRKRQHWAASLLLAAVIVAGAAGALVSRNADAQVPVLPGEYDQDSVLVTFHDNAPRTARVNAVARQGLRANVNLPSPYFTELIIPPAALANGATVSSVVANLKNDPAVRIVEPNYIRKPAAVPNDPRFGELYGLRNTGQGGGLIGADIKATQAWDVTTGSDTVIVAVNDTGVDYNHEDLKDNILKNAAGAVVGFDFMDNDADPNDPDPVSSGGGHGTHCAGTIGARGNNAIGITGVCQRVKIMPVRVLAATGGTLAAVISGMDFAVQNGAKIVSCSYGAGGPGSAQEFASILRARAAGVLVVAAAGNGGSDGIGDDNDAVPHFPSSYRLQADNVIAVAASNNRDALTGFTNFGKTSVDVAAPGDNTLSTIPGNAYDFKSGTSMATPHVSGALALILSLNPTLRYLELKQRLLNAVDLIPAFNGKMVTPGRINVRAAMQLLRVKAPNGGNTFVTGRPTTITWTSEGFTPSHTVRLDLSRDGGATFETIADNVSDTGSFAWTPTGPETTRARIRIVSKSSATVSDLSDADFRLVSGSLTVTAPNGGESLRTFEPVDITWSSQGFATNASQVRIELSRDGGTTWETVFTSTINDGSQTWLVTGPATDRARFRVSTLGAPGFSDESDADIEIRDIGIVLNFPNGGEVFVSGEPIDILWSSVGFSGNVKIEYSTNGGIDWETIFPDTPNDGLQTWGQRAVPTRLGRIRVTALEDPALTDVSDGFFTIESPGIQVISPVRTRTALIGTEEAIDWVTTGVGFTTDMNVELSRDGGTTFEPIEIRTDNDGNVVWNVTGPATPSAVVRVRLSDDATVFGVSPVFSIASASLFVVNPNGGEKLSLGDQQTLRWSGTSVGHGTVTIELSRNNGRSFETLFNGVPNNGSIAWGVSGKTTNKARIRITWDDDGSVDDESDRPFSIKKAPKGKKGR